MPSMYATVLALTKAGFNSSSPSSMHYCNCSGVALSGSLNTILSTALCIFPLSLSVFITGATSSAEQLRFTSKDSFNQM